MSIKLRKESAASVSTPPATHTQFFVDTDGLAKFKNSSGAVVPALPLVNAGPPEGVVTANIGVLCADNVNGELYIKNTGTGTNTGWSLISRV